MERRVLVSHTCIVMFIHPDLSELFPPRKALANGLFFIFICVTYKVNIEC